MTPARLDAWRVVSTHAAALTRLAERLGIKLTIEMAIAPRRRWLGGAR